MPDMLCTFDALTLRDSFFPDAPRRSESGTFRVSRPEGETEEVTVEPPPRSETRGTRRLTEADDVTLVEEARTGSDWAATAIWNRYAGLVRAMLRRSLGRDEVDDAVQEVFIRLFPALPQLRQAASLRSFIIGITLRVAGTGLRRRKCRDWLQLTPTGEVGDFATPSHHDFEAHEALGRFYAILDKLSTKPRLVFVLRYVEGMEVAEVAASLHISLATAKRHLARASARVHAMVERDPSLVSYVTGNDSRSSDRSCRVTEELPVHARRPPRVAGEARA